MSDRDTVIALLEQQNTILRAILQALSPDGSAQRAAAGAVATDSDLDSQYGNPEIRKDPKRWNGATMRGRKFSECPPEFLDVLASFYDWQADQAEKNRETTNSGKPVAPYRRQDAARARGWAARIRAGKVQQPQQAALPGPAFEEPTYKSEPGFEQSDFTPSNW